MAYPSHVISAAKAAYIKGYTDDALITRVENQTAVKIESINTFYNWKSAAKKKGDDWGKKKKEYKKVLVQEKIDQQYKIDNLEWSYSNEKLEELLEERSKFNDDFRATLHTAFKGIQLELKQSPDAEGILVCAPNQERVKAIKTSIQAMVLIRDNLKLFYGSLDDIAGADDDDGEGVDLLSDVVNEDYDELLSMTDEYFDNYTDSVLA